MEQKLAISHFNTEKKRIYDVHTHVFNARYLPLRGIFKSFGIEDKFNKPLAWICWFLTEYTKFPDLKQIVPRHLINIDIADVETEELRDALITDSYIEAIALNCDKLIKTCLAPHNFPSDIFKQDSRTENELELQDISTQDFALSAIRYTLKALSVENEQNNIWLNENKDIKNNNLLTYPFADMFINFFREAFSKIDHALDYLDFVWNLTQSEKHIYIRLREFYRAMGVDCSFVHHMMDMANPYIEFEGSRNYGQVKLPYYAKNNEHSQLSQMHALASYSEGKLIGFSAFDPWRFSNSKNVVSSVRLALEEAENVYGMRGFKFYPPMGYRPDENESHPKVQLAIDSFLDFCNERQKPIFTHCSPGGFEVGLGSGLNSNPIFWRKMLEANSYRKNLKICFGHAGGGRFLTKKDEKLISAGWVASEIEWTLDGNYAREVVQLCRDYPNVYCELANINSILSNADDALNLHINLDRELNNLNGKHLFHQKLMYGTDWHMVGMVNDLTSYYQYLSNLFDQKSLAAFKSTFFYENAREFLN